MQLQQQLLQCSLHYVKHSCSSAAEHTVPCRILSIPYARRTAQPFQHHFPAPGAATAGKPGWMGFIYSQHSSAGKLAGSVVVGFDGIVAAEAQNSRQQ
jgi:hypothetical protein